MDYEGWANGLKKAGYATNPKYPQILIRIINDYNLQDYTLIAMGKKASAPAEVWASSTTPASGEALGSGPSAPQARSVVYPLGVFKINETSVVFATKGTPFIALASDYHIPLRRLFDFNDMEPQESVPADGLIYLQRKRKHGSSEKHTVAPGETVYDIAQAEGMRLESLLKYNFLASNSQPEPGQVLYLKDEAPAMPRLISPFAKKKEIFTETDTRVAKLEPKQQKDNDFLLHVVSAKETAYSIAKRYAVTVADLLKWNDMDTADLRTGQQLRISKKNTNATN
jgi:LysM repeat protein